MADDPTAQAIDVVARRLIVHATTKSTLDDWDLYPEIGEYDWRAIGARVNALTRANDPSDEQYEAAYEHLTARATAVDARE
jgi:hypothetical protein